MKVLVLKPDHLGDFALALPALWELVQRVGHRELVRLLVHPSNEEWASLLPWLPPLQSVLHPRYSWDEARIPQLWVLGRQMLELRHNRFDFGINLIGANVDRWGGALLRMAGCHEILGRFNTDPVTSDRIKHESLRLAEKFPAEWQITGQTTPQVFMPEAFRRDSEEMIVLAPASRTSAKSWPIEFWQELRRKLPAERTVILLPADTSRTGTKDLWQDAAITLVHSIQDTLQVLRRSAVVVALDTAVAHYSWLVGVPVVQLFAGTADVRRWGCLAPGRILTHPTVCTPCRLETCCRLHHECMEKITVERVLDTIQEVLRAC